jgi:hypothetical protein
MKNSLKFYQDSFDGADFPVQIIPIGLSGLGLFVGGLFCLPPLSPWGLHLAIISAVVLITNLMLHATSIYRGFSKGKMAAAKEYRNLSKQDQKALKFDIKDLADIPDEAVGDLRFKIGELKDKTANLQREKNKFSGPGFTLNQRLAEAIKERDLDLSQTREVNQEIAKMLDERA